MQRANSNTKPPSYDQYNKTPSSIDSYELLNAATTNADVPLEWALDRAQPDRDLLL